MSSKQNATAHSNCQAEFQAASEASKEAFWLKKFLEELQVAPSAELPVPLYSDNEGVVSHAKEPRSHHNNKCIERKHHIIIDMLKN